MAPTVNADDEERSSGPVRLDQLKTYISDETDVSGSRLGAGYQATVKLYETPLGNYVVKTARGPFFWRRLGEFSLRRG